MFRFLHAADVHLDSPLIGLDRYESAPVDTVRGATRRAFANLVGLAIEEGVAFVVLAGDLYDGDWKDYRTGLFFVEQMARLREAEIPVFIVAGNHDAASQLTKNLRPPDNVRFLSAKKPETHVIEAIDVALHGQGYANREVTADLAEAYPAADARLFHVGLLHTSLDGRPGHAPYAPTSSQRLAQKGYHYWALGHVHRREIVSEDPWIVFPGNLQGRHARETGAKSCTLVTVDNGTVQRVEERPVDVLRWAVLRIDAESATTTCAVLDRVSHAIVSEADRSDGRALAVRVEVVGTAACHDDFASDPDHWTQEVRALATAVGSADVWIEKVRIATERSIHLSRLADRDDAIWSLVRDIEAAASDPAELDALRASLVDLRGLLPRELLDGDDAVDPHAEKTLAGLIAEARELLLARLARQGSAS